MNVFKTIGCNLVALTFVFASASSAHAGDMEKSQRLRISGWTMVGAGAVLFGTGMGLALSLDCHPTLGCDDEQMYRKNTGFAVLAGGLAAAVGVGMPMLIRARKVAHDEAAELGDEATNQGRSHVTLRIGPGSLMLRGAF